MKKWKNIFLEHFYSTSLSSGNLVDGSALVLHTHAVVLCFVRGSAQNNKLNPNIWWKKYFYDTNFKTCFSNYLSYILMMKTVWISGEMVYRMMRFMRSQIFNKKKRNEKSKKWKKYYSRALLLYESFER